LLEEPSFYELRSVVTSVRQYTSIRVVAGQPGIRLEYGGVKPNLTASFQ